MKKAIFITDHHYPFHNKKTLELQRQIIRKVKPEIIIFGGDNWDANGISKFTAKKPEAGIIDTLNEMLGFKDEIFDPIKKDAKNPEIHLLLGNHEGQRLTDRFNKLIDKGETSTYNYWKNQFNLKKIFNCKVYDYNEVLKIGKLNYIHGEKHNKYHANSHFEILMESVMYGHLHSTQVYTRITKKNEPFQAISVPCSCNINPDYMKNRASAWLNGMAIIYYYPNGNYNYYVLQFINNQVIFNNILYK